MDNKVSSLDVFHSGNNVGKKGLKPRGHVSKQRTEIKSPSDGRIMIIDYVGVRASLDLRLGIWDVQAGESWVKTEEPRVSWAKSHD